MQPPWAVRTFRRVSAKVGPERAAIVVGASGLWALIAVLLVASTVVYPSSFTRLDLTVSEFTFTVPAAGETQIFEPADLAGLVVSDVDDIGFRVGTTGRTAHLHRFAASARCSVTPVHLEPLRLPPGASIQMTADGPGHVLTMIIREKSWLESVQAIEKSMVMCSGLAENGGRTMTRPLPLAVGSHVSFVTGTETSFALRFDPSTSGPPTAHDVPIDPRLNVVGSAEGAAAPVLLDAPSNQIALEDGRRPRRPAPGDFVKVSGSGPLFIRSLELTTGLHLAMDGQLSHVLVGSRVGDLSNWSPSWFTRYRRSLIAIALSLVPGLVAFGFLFGGGPSSRPAPRRPPARSVPQSRA